MSALLTAWVRSTAIAYGLKATPVYGRHTHTKPLPRLGGIAICVTFMTAALAYIPIARYLQIDVSTKGYLGILIPVLLIFSSWGTTTTSGRSHRNQKSQLRLLQRFCCTARGSGFTSFRHCLADG